MRASLLLLLLAAPLTAQTGPASRPRPGEVFPPLLADPRQALTSASYYRHRGRNAFDLGLGRAWGVKRWRSGEDQSLLWEADVEGMSYSRFRVESGRGDFETVDFLGALPLTVRRGDVAFKGSVFVENSHLGDDHIRRYGTAGYRYSTIGLRLLGSLDPHPLLRVYGGVSRYLRSVPDPARWTLQAGVELTSGDLRLNARVPVRAYAATDFQPRERVGWNPDWRTVAGLKLGAPDHGRMVRVQVGHHRGHSPYHQFYRERDQYTDLSIVLEH